MSTTPSTSDRGPLIDLGKLPNPVFKALYPLIGPLVNKLLRIAEVNEVEREVSATGTPDTFFARTLEVLGCRYEVSDSDLERIPATGPVVVVSNHPLGGLDGIVLGDLLRRRRKDTKLMANYLLQRIPLAKHHMIFVDPFPKAAPSAQNIAPLRESLKHLKAGGLLGVFPGNKVSHYQRDRHEISDPEWVPHIASIIRRSGATVVPLFIEAQNSRFFSYAGLIHPVLRTLLLPGEFMRRGQSRVPIRVHIGTAIPSPRLKKFATEEEMIRFLRLSTYMLSNRPKPVMHAAPEQPRPAKVVEPVAEPLSPELLEADLASLPADCRLLTQGEFEIYMARYQQMPHIMHEIGRGREVSFRYAGGGTLKPLDLAAQDEYYHHLILWNKKDRAVVGAYRIGLTDEILDKHGPQGLISSGLFHLKPDFLKTLNPGLELGRSYVLPEFQRNYNSLVLLWGGIIAFVGRHPKYRTVFGAVGVSQGDEYCAASRTLVVNFMRNQHSNPALALQVESYSPFQDTKLHGLTRAEVSSLVKNIEDVSSLVAGLEQDGKGVPVLIKHYLRMNAKLLDFGVWKNHSNAVVGFLIADMTTVDARYLRKFMGDDGYVQFRAFHGLPSDGAETTSDTGMTAA